MFVYATPGSGKQTIVNTLKATNNYQIVDTDSYRENFIKNDVKFPIEPYYSNDGAREVKGKIYDYIRQNKNINVVCDSASKSTFEKIYNLCKNYSNKECHIIFTDFYKSAIRAFNRGKKDGRGVYFAYLVDENNNFPDYVKCFFDKEMPIYLYNNDQQMTKIGEYKNGELKIENLPLFCKV